MNVDWVRQALTALPESPNDIRQYVVDVFDAAFQFDYATAFSVMRKDGDIVVDWGIAAERHRATAQYAFWASFQGNKLPADQIGWNPECPRREETTGFRTLAELGDVKKLAGWASLYEPFGIVDQVRTLIYDGDRFVAWLGGVSRTPLSDETVAAVQSLHGPLCDALRVATRLDAVTDPVKSICRRSFAPA